MGTLKSFMRINRGRHFQINIEPPQNIPTEQPGTPPVGPPPAPVETYNLADFGENVINNHYFSDGSHSEKCQIIFNYITKDFRNRCTSLQSYKTELLYNDLIWRGNYLNKCAQVNADMVFTPYVNAAYSSEGEYYDFILPVASHRDNSGLRYDITANAETLLINTVAVAARRDTPSTFQLGTSFGNGVEFFVDCSPAALDLEYPNKDIPSAFAELLSDDGITLTSIIHPNFNQNLEAGEQIIIRFTQDESTWETTTITDISLDGSIIVSPAITPISNGGIYGWHNITLGTFMGGQAQSWAVPIVAGKLKVIKMTTGADWNTVRMAARVTAKRNITGIEEIDNVNWDIYRGFGCIDIQAAIEFIKLIIKNHV